MVINRDYAPPVRHEKPKRNPWRFRRDPLVKTLGEIKPSGPSIRGPGGHMYIDAHIRDATKSTRPRRGLRWMLRIIILVTVVAIIIGVIKTL